MSRGLGPSFALATRQKHKQYRDEFLDHEGVCVCVCALTIQRHYSRVSIMFVVEAEAVLFHLSPRP
jgi:hypothetical protein